MRRALFSCLVLAFLAQPALAQQKQPPCLTPDAVEEAPGTAIWLLKAKPGELRKRFEKLTGSKSWQGDDLHVSCAAEGKPADVVAVTVEGGVNEKAVALRKEFFSDLARKTGHSQREADALAKQYALHVDGAFFRTLADVDGQLVSEDELILRKHQQQLEVADPSAPVAPARSREEEIQALRAKMTAAKQRGDMDEAMRLATEAQRLGAPAVTAVHRMKKTADQLAWEASKLALPELAAAAYRARVTVDPPCARCLLVKK